MTRRQLFQIGGGALAAAGQALGWLKKPKVEPLRGFIHSYGGEVWAVLFNRRGVISERPIGIDPAVRDSILNDPVWSDDPSLAGVPYYQEGSFQGQYLGMDHG